MNVPTLTREGLMEALDLIDQQRELEAAEMVVTALSYIAESIASAEMCSRRKPSSKPWLHLIRPLKEQQTPNTFRPGFGRPPHLKRTSTPTVPSHRRKRSPRAARCT